MTVGRMVIITHSVAEMLFLGCEKGNKSWVQNTEEHQKHTFFLFHQHVWKQRDTVSGAILENLVERLIEACCSKQQLEKPFCFYIVHVRVSCDVEKPSLFVT